MKGETFTHQPGYRFLGRGLLNFWGDYFFSTHMCAISHWERFACCFYQKLIVCCSLWCLSAVLRVFQHCDKPLGSLVLTTPGQPKSVIPHYHSESNETETNFSRRSVKSQNVMWMLHSSLSLPCEKSQSRLLLLIVELGGGTEMVEIKQIFLLIFMSMFLALSLSEALQLSNWFLEVS